MLRQPRRRLLQWVCCYRRHLLQWVYRHRRRHHLLRSEYRHHRRRHLLRSEYHRHRRHHLSHPVYRRPRYRPTCTEPAVVLERSLAIRLLLIGILLFIGIGEHLQQRHDQGADQFGDVGLAVVGLAGVLRILHGAVGVPKLTSFCLSLPNNSALGSIAC